MVVTCALMDIRTSQWTAQDVITLYSSHSCLTDPNPFVLWKTLGSGAQFSVFNPSLEGKPFKESFKGTLKEERAEEVEGRHEGEALKGCPSSPS